MADGHIKIVTAIDNSMAVEEFKEFEEAIEKYADKSEKKLNNKLDKMRHDFDKLANKMKQVQSDIEMYEEMIEVSQHNLWRHRQGIEVLDADQLKQVTNDLVYAKKELESLNVSANETAFSMQRMRNIASEHTDKLEQGSEKAKRLNTNIKEASKSAKGLDVNIGKGVKKLGRYALAMFSIRSAYTLISRLARGVINSNDEMGQKLKAQIESITNAVTNLLAPAVKFVVNMVATLVGYLAGALKILFGIDILAKKTGKNLAGGVAKANKEMKKFLAGFDEIEKLSSDTGDDSSGANQLDAGMVLPDMSKFDDLVSKMKKALSNLWNSKTVQSYFDSVYRIGKRSFDSLRLVTSNAWDNIYQSFLEMLPNLKLGFSNMFEYWRQILEDIANVSDVWFPAITERINEFINNIFDTFRPITTFISRVWSEFTQIMLDLWNKHGAPILDEIGKFIDGAIDTFNKIWTHIIKPIVEPALAFLSKMWDEHIKDILFQVGDLVGTIILEALKFYNQFIKPIVDWLAEFLEPAFRFYFNYIFGIVTSVFGNIFNSIKGVIGNLKGIFTGFMTFLEGIFTGDWKKIWTGLVTILKNIIGGIANIFKAPINVMIDGLNTFIKGLNKVKIPDWVPGVGGKGINIGTIPRLQRGAVINRPMQALVGDGGREAVIPLENDTRALEEIAALLAGFIGATGGREVINVNINGRTILEIVLDEAKKAKMQNNGGLAYEF